MKIEHAVVLCSGGLNSAVVASLAKADYAPALLHVRLAHRAARREEEMYERLAERLVIADRLAVDMPHFAAIGDNARLSHHRSIEDALAPSEGLAGCCIPGLIPALVFAAYAYAVRIGATRIFLGVSERPGPPAPPTGVPFPDYGREAAQLLNHLLSVLSTDREVVLDTPLIDLDRTEIVRLGERLGTPFELTWSCMAREDRPCGRCIGCATRIRGFIQAAVPDPVVLTADAT